MFLVYYVVIFVGLFVTLLRCYPLAVAAWVDALFVAVDSWFDDKADAAQSRRRERVAELEHQIAQWDEQQAVLRWMQVVLLSSPSAQPDDGFLEHSTQAE